MRLLSTKGIDCSPQPARKCARRREQLSCHRRFKRHSSGHSVPSGALHDKEGLIRRSAIARSKRTKGRGRAIHMPSKWYCAGALESQALIELNRSLIIVEHPQGKLLSSQSASPVHERDHAMRHQARRAILVSAYNIVGFHLMVVVNVVGKPHMPDRIAILVHNQKENPILIVENQAVQPPSCALSS